MGAGVLGMRYLLATAGGADVALQTAELGSQGRVVDQAHTAGEEERLCVPSRSSTR
jgi:hypothetical protein